MRKKIHLKDVTTNEYIGFMYPNIKNIVTMKQFNRLFKKVPHGHLIACDKHLVVVDDTYENLIWEVEEDLRFDSENETFVNVFWKGLVK